MKFEDTPMKIVKRTAHCDCGGLLTETGAVLYTCPPKYPHKCDACGELVNLDGQYPQAWYREENNDAET